MSNTTQSALRGIVYGPALKGVRFIHPVYRPITVSVMVGKQRRPYVGFVIPAVETKTPAHVLFRLAKLPNPQPILASPHAAIHDASWSDVANSDCSIK